MPRQVFFDPFGRAAEGYQAGMQQEQGLQQNVRAARQTDWDYNNINPYRLADTQRQNILGTAALPYQLQMPAIGLDEAKTALATHQEPLAENFYRLTGIAAPWAGVNANAFGMTPTGRDAQGNISYTMRGPNGEQSNVGSLNPQTTYNAMMLPQQMEYAKNQAMINYYNGMAQYGRGGVGAYTYDMARAFNLGQPQGQGFSPVDRFFTPQQPGQSGGGSGGVQTYPQPQWNTGGMPQQQPNMSPYNLPPVNLGNISPQQLQQYDY